MNRRLWERALETDFDAEKTNPLAQRFRVARGTIATSVATPTDDEITSIVTRPLPARTDPGS